ncbi:hypothetical protein B566_EDAN004386 [Ephemera danica]|nr:hypothetical protein B566_EDAN004386 [Ephemera danica]
MYRRLILPFRLGVINPLQNRGNCAPVVSFSTSQLEECVASSDDGSLIALWHPEKPILYENTKSLHADQAKMDTSVLKKVDLKNLQRTKPDELVRQELMALTYTTKHRWFPRSRDKKHRKPPVKREWL